MMAQLGEVKGQLTIMMQLMQQNHDSTHQRINDFRHSVEGRLGGVEARIGVIEKNERGTAIKSATSGALAGAVMAGGIAVLKFAVSH